MVLYLLSDPKTIMNPRHVNLDFPKTFSAFSRHTKSQYFHFEDGGGGRKAAGQEFNSGTVHVSSINYYFRTHPYFLVMLHEKNELRGRYYN